MELRILGSLEVVDQTRQVQLPGGRGRALLGLLILHAGRPLSADRLVDELWGERPPRTARTVIQGHVSRLRRALEPGRDDGPPRHIIETVGIGYRLAVDADAVDANRFKRLLDEARHESDETRSAMLSAALSLWRGPALADFRYEPFAQQAIRVLEELRIEALERRIEADLALGRSSQLVAELEELIAAHPFRERLRSLLMLALYRAGRQAEAVAVFRNTRSLLIEELGVEPGRALRELESAILRQDPALELRPERPLGESVTATPESWLPRERRPVTVVAVDLVPAAGPEADPETVGLLGRQAAELAAEVFERHGGRVDRFIGGMLMAFFGWPVAHEDDALRAVRAGLELRGAIARLNHAASHSGGLPIRCRVGINSGDVVVSGPGGALHEVVAGAVVTSAVGLQQAGNDDILVGSETQRLLRGTVVFRPVGEVVSVAGGEAAWAVLDVLPAISSTAGTLDRPMFGRQEELARMRSAFRRAVRSNAPARLVVLGDAGIGKSRLTRELAAALDAESHAITVRCPPYGGAAAFFPLRQAVIEAAGLYGWRALHDLLANEGSGRFVADIGAAVGTPATPENVGVLFPAFRRLLEILASERPLLMTLDDLHWAEPAFLDFIDDVLDRATGPLFLCCVTRTELLERRPEWERTDAIRLGPLPLIDLESLVVDRAGSIEREALGRITEMSKGNPLFAEQLLAALGEGDIGAVPASLRGLLAMRLDHLGPGERDLLRSASIVGTAFDQAALSALLPDTARPFLEWHLHALVRKNLLERTGAGTFRFSHVLVQLAAYRSITLDDRARLHENFQGWLDREASDVRGQLGR